MSPDDFRRLIVEAFSPFLLSRGFTLVTEYTSVGHAYIAEFERPDCVLGISYEHGDNYREVHLIRKIDGRTASIDGPDAMVLGELGRRFGHLLTKEEIADNNSYFASMIANGKEEKLLLGCARRLRLFLPYYLLANSVGGG